MSTNDCDCGAMDRRALLKNGVVFIIGFFGMIYFAIYQRLCADAKMKSISDCRFVYFGLGGDMTGKHGVYAVWYVCFYSTLMIVSILGLFNVCCSKLGCMKIYSVCLMAIIFCISICDFVTMAAIGTVYKDEQHLREFYTFQVLLFWFLQAAIITSTAFDAFFSCQKKHVYVPKSPEVVLVSHE